MPLSTRVLPVAEYPRLAGTELENVWPHLPETAQVLVIEDAGVIVGCWAVLTCVHVEGLWIAPSHRKQGRVARRLLSAMRSAADDHGVTSVLTAATSPEVRALIERFGGHAIAGAPFLMPVRHQGPPASRARALALGRAFHEQLSTQVEEPLHADDEQHDYYVGRALITAVEQRDPIRAERDYNAWAYGAGYVPIRFIGSTADAHGRRRYVVDIQTAVIAIDEAFTVHVQGAMPCL